MIKIVNDLSIKHKNRDDMQTLTRRYFFIVAGKRTQAVINLLLDHRRSSIGLRNWYSLMWSGCWLFVWGFSCLLRVKCFHIVLNLLLFRLFNPDLIIHTKNKHSHSKYINNTLREIRREKELTVFWLSLSFCHSSPMILERSVRTKSGCSALSTGRLWLL